jgi:hypothetical protein
MKRISTLRGSSALAVGGLALTFGAAAPLVHAGPAMSELSYTADFDQDACVQRAQVSFGNDGWQGVSTNGYTIMANRGPLSGVIVCLNQSLTQSIPVIVVAGGNGNAGDDEANALKSQLNSP